MSDLNEQKEQKIGLWLAGGAATLSTLAVLIYAVYGWQSGKIEGSPDYGKKSTQAALNCVGEVTASGEALTSCETEEAVAAAASAETAVPAQPDMTAANAADHEAKVVVADNGTVKFYFASGKAELAAGAREALKEVLAGVEAGKKAVISGYHDASGSVAQNEELSKQRAFAVRDTLMGFGVPEVQIELRKPQSADAGQGAEARRVEVVLE